MGADLSPTEVFVSVRNYFTRLPYVTSDGQTSLNLPIESAEWTDVMWEAKVNDIATATITLPSLIAHPGLRELYQQIKEGDRVEIFHFQPDCGDPVFAGFIPPNGITEEDGKTILNVDDTLGQLKWQHIRRVEQLSGPAATFYTRSLATWQDIIAEDFPDETAQNDYLVTTANSPGVQWAAGSVTVTGPGAGGGPVPSVAIQSPTTAAGAFAINPGDTFLLEADVAFTTQFVTAKSWAEVVLIVQQQGQVNVFGGFVLRAGAHLRYVPSALAAYPEGRAVDAEVYPPPMNGPNYDPGISQYTSNLPQWPRPLTHHFAVYMQFSTGQVTIFAFVDNVNVAFTTQPWNFTTQTYVPTLQLNAARSDDFVQCTSFRATRLVPVIIPAGRFNPQTQDAVTYQPNNEENLQLLQLFAEQDDAEYRPIYRQWPQIDELELDAASTLGNYASRVLGYEQPPNIPLGGAPEAAPFPAIVDSATFLRMPLTGEAIQILSGGSGVVGGAFADAIGGDPPFRFEEGQNLESAPRILARANAHANDVIRVGSSTADAQVVAEEWSPTELGRPQHSPSGAEYPRFEQITNDDRVGIQSVVADLAGFELARRTDATPSLELALVDEVPFAFKWRAGDTVLVRTQSLRNNLDQEMRVQKVAYAAGSPVRTVTLGHMEQDPTMLRMLAEDTKISWLYDQSGANPGIYAYPFLGNIGSGSESSIFKIPLDQFTSGTALVYAALHWFADAHVMTLQPRINGNLVPLTGLTSVSDTDSGLVFITGRIQRVGNYELSFRNTDSVTRNLTSAFLVLRLKA